MLQTEVLKKYKQMFNIGDEEVDTWFPNGINSVRVRLKNKKELVFTYHSDKKWRLETSDQFIESLKGR